MPIPIKKKAGYSKCYGSMTVEAALVLPLFLYFFFSFLMFFEIFRIQEQLQGALTEAGRSFARYAFVYHNILDRDETASIDEGLWGVEEIRMQDFTGAILDSSFVRYQVKRYLKVEEINQSFIKGGFNGIDFFSSSVLDEDECIDIIARYRMELPIRLFHIDELPMVQRVRLRAWTGNRVGREVNPPETPENNEVVYITETGTVYHVSKSCTHLKISIESIQGIPKNVRNSNGGRYYPCERCQDRNLEGKNQYYITKEGTRYHTSIACSSLKRTTLEITKADVGERKECSRCGKGG